MKCQLVLIFTVALATSALGQGLLGRCKFNSLKRGNNSIELSQFKLNHSNDFLFIIQSVPTKSQLAAADQTSDQPADQPGATGLPGSRILQCSKQIR